MISDKQAKARVHGIYGRMKARFGPKKWGSGKRKGQLRDPGRELPFTEAELREWIISQVGYGGIRCPYCGVPMDILCVSLDHDVPVAQGGSLGLENLTLCCELCNRIKGSIAGAEFRRLREFISTLAIASQADIVSRLRMGAMGLRLRFHKKGAL